MILKLRNTMSTFSHFIIGCFILISNINAANAIDKIISPQDQSKIESISLKAIFDCNNSEKSYKKKSDEFIIECKVLKKFQKYNFQMSDNKNDILYKGQLYKREKIGKWKNFPNKETNYEVDFKKQVEFDYSWGLEGGIIKIWGKVKNESDQSLKDLKVSCVVYSESQTVLQKLNTVLYKNFDSKKTTKFQEISLGIAPNFLKSLGCSLELSDIK